MDDIVTRLRRWTHAVDAAPASDLMDEAADEIERLRFTGAECAALDRAIAFIQGAGYSASDLVKIRGRTSRQPVAG